MIELIYCGAGNPRYARIAHEHGFLIGAQLPGSVYLPLHFADQHWKKPRRARYMQALAQHRPHMATVLDLERPEQLPEVLDWADEASEHVQEVIFIPKYAGAIRALPRAVNGKRVRLGYSVPTRYGGTTVPVADFRGWPVHLLGGSPKAQVALAGQMDVVSADGNQLSKVARFGTLFDGRVWKNFDRYRGKPYHGQDMPYAAFSISCFHMLEMWRRYYDDEVIAEF